jgi:hypothetical protein
MIEWQDVVNFDMTEFECRDKCQAQAMFGKLHTTWDNVEGNSAIRLSYRVISTDVRTASEE